MKRREFITLLGVAAALPRAARAQQPALPVIGYLSSFPADINPKFTQAFQQGLSEAGFFEGRNVTIEYRWDEEGRYDRLPMMAADLVGRRVAVLFASPIPAALAAKAATDTIPIVFAIGSDPVETGLVVSLNRPGGNVTGATFLSVALGAKRLELLRDLVPKIASIGLLVNPNNPNAAVQTKEMQEATTALGVRLNVLSAASQSDFENVFATLVRQRADALLVSADPFFLSHRDQLGRELINPSGWTAYESALVRKRPSAAATCRDVPIATSRHSFDQLVGAREKHRTGKVAYRLLPECASKHYLNDATEDYRRPNA